MQSCNADCIFTAVLIVFYTRSCVPFFMHNFVYRDLSINYACVLDLSIFYFIKMGTMFPFNTFFVFVSFMSSYQVHIEFFYKVHHKYNLNVYNALITPGFLGIKGNNVNYFKFKAYFLLSYGSMNVLALSRGVFVIFECR